MMNCSPNGHDLKLSMQEKLDLGFTSGWCSSRVGVQILHVKLFLISVSGLNFTLFLFFSVKPPSGEAAEPRRRVRSARRCCCDCRNFADTEMLFSILVQ